MTTHPDRWLRRIAFVITALSTTTALAVPTQVSYCGQSFRGRGVLVGDLDCSGFGGVGVTIERGRLEFNGFAIRGAAQYGVQCLSTCQLRGPGLITGNGLDGVRTEGWVAVRDMRITDNALDGINARNISNAGRVHVSDSTIANNGFNGVESDSVAILRRTAVTGNLEQGLDCGVLECDSIGRVVIYRSTVTGNGSACVEGPVCADVTSCGRKNRAPRVRLSSCHKSYVRGSGVPGQSWSVCSQD
jgi:hypothetical protein